MPNFPMCKDKIFVNYIMKKVVFLSTLITDLDFLSVILLLALFCILTFYNISFVYFKFFILSSDSDPDLNLNPDL